MRWADPAEVPAEVPDDRRAPSTNDRALFAVALAASAFVLLWPSLPGAPLFPYADKLLHIMIFLALVFTGSRAGLSWRGLVIGLVAYAIGTEVVQETLLPGRSGDWTDVMADVVGVAVGLAVARTRRRPERAR